MGRYLILCAAFWCLFFAIGNGVQLALVEVPEHLRPVFIGAWAVMALIYTPIAVLIIRKGETSQ